MIFDCFTFFNENDLVEIRLNTLNNIVDKFIIIEATKTHSDREKELCFDKKRFIKFANKIQYVILDKYPEFETSWTYENYQRNYIFDILKESNCSDNDIIIISDCDEIPNPKAIKRYFNKRGIYSLEQKFYYYYLNCLNVSQPYWNFPKILRYKDFFDENYNVDFKYNEYVIEKLNKHLTPTKIRYIKPNGTLTNGGWHFSYLGSSEQISQKLNSFSHQEFNTKEINNPSNLKYLIDNKKDILGRDFTYQAVPIDASFPVYIQKNKQKLQSITVSLSIVDILRFIPLYISLHILYCKKEPKRYYIRILNFIKISFKK